ncbi:sulfatase family protein [Maribacter ulvicola]|uniref:Uncharacterized sulfatase n=1 Tax=Maribacter ulvicola TaxID=228959 RepID=A0A1N6X6U7_9FLAO|nr:sulfatase [Maribacter ulvicola]SIQ98068.1 uncharacterized sulfatase [Maribacter ulvicola]
MKFKKPTSQFSMYFKFITCFLALVIILSGCNEVKNAVPEPKQPNIVWIIAEDMSQDLACYGNDLVKTPILDELASRGVRYQNAFANGPACSPSRTSLITGYYQNSIGAHHMRYPDSLRPDLPKGVEPIHILLKKKGYQVANITSGAGTGKTDWLFDYDPKTYDKSTWKELNKDAPFFARISLGLTHRKFARDKKNPVDPNKITIPPYYPDHAVTRNDWAGYYESIQLLDRQVGSIIDELKTNDLLDNTLIFFFSDHGRPMIRAKNFLYDSGLKIPLIVASYDQQIKEDLLPSQSVDESMLSLIDLSATTLNLAGETDYKTQGKPFLGHQNVADKKYVYGAVDRIGNIFLKSRTVRSKRFRYIRNYNNDLSINAATTAYRRANHPIYHLLNILNDRGELDAHQSKLVHKMEYEELYDVIYDPYELDNLALKPEWQNKLKDLSNNLDDWLKRIDDKGLYEDSEDIKRAFESYGKKTMAKQEKSIEKLHLEVKKQSDLIVKTNKN